MSNSVKFVVYEIDVETGKLTYPMSAFVEFSGPTEEASKLYEQASLVAAELAFERKKEFTIVKVYV